MAIFVRQSHRRQQVTMPTRTPCPSVQFANQWNSGAISSFVLGNQIFGSSALHLEVFSVDRFKCSTWYLNSIGGDRENCLPIPRIHHVSSDTLHLLKARAHYDVMKFSPPPPICKTHRLSAFPLSHTTTIVTKKICWLFTFWLNRLRNCGRNFRQIFSSPKSRENFTHIETSLAWECRRHTQHATTAEASAQTFD